ncbi:hypothetical protein OG979_33055 [Actinomadura citrea]|uniref:hypothetical protein n=1 Tax=Actinomadura citrea TaxID=46158 RepID=UPI002E2D7826|nr:hypothetical protein [Actinomadura citrea]
MPELTARAVEILRRGPGGRWNVGSGYLVGRRLLSDDLPPVRFARVDRSRTGQVGPCWAIGFPR